MIQKKIVIPKRVEWNELVERLSIFKTREQYHPLLETIIFCIKMIEEGRFDGDDVKFYDGLSLLLECCKRLIEVAEEFFYSQRLGAIVLRLVGALRNQAALSSQKKVMDFIDDCLPYTNEALIKYVTLCKHECSSVEDFFPSHLANPYHLLNEIHTYCQRMAQSNLERYVETAIVTRVVDYWRTLFNVNNVCADIQPLIELGDDLLSRVRECSDPKRKKDLWKMVLLLQMLLRDHPAVKTLKSQDWPAEGFVQSLLPFEYQSSSVVQQSVNKLPNTLLKDYKPQLKASRQIFEDAITDKTDVFKAQESHSRQVIQMLEEMVLATRKMLGPPPCEIVVCILGSTSRHDRRPYSDLEYMILHREVPVDKKQDLDLYICHFISIFELMIVSLGETSSNHNNNRNGFKIDQSLLGLTVSFKSKSWGTPEEVAKKYVIELNEPPHGWLDKGLFEYLHPIALECPELGSRALFEQYLKELNGYLNQIVCEEDSPNAITQHYKIQVEGWWKGLMRRQGIALASLCEVVRSNENMYLDINAGCIVNLKTYYYKPLLYCALSLGMYEGCQALTPSKTIQAYCARMTWGGEALLLWWQSALEYVVKEQIKQHIHSRGQNDSMIVSEDERWAGFDLIVEGFILPLQKGVRKYLSGSLSISMLGYVILKGYLNVRTAWLEKWEGKGLKRSELLTHPLMAVLTSYPDESGWSPQMERILKQHHKGLLMLTDDNKTDCQLTGVPLAHPQSIRYLKQYILSQCFKEGKFVGDPEFSSERSQVKKVRVGDRIWYAKVKDGNLEGLMAREYMAMMLHLLLGGKPQIALGWPIKLTLQSEGKATPNYAWVSENAAGESLAEVMQAFPETWKSLKFERNAFSQLFLFTLLTCPEDGQPENFKVIERDGEIEFIAIDYGQCFVVGERQEKRLLGNDVSVLTLKTIVYFLDDMHKPLSEDLITRIRILDIDAWYSCWKSSMSGINALFKPILEENLGSGPQFQGNKNKELIDLPEDVMLCIKSRLVLLQQSIQKSQGPITGQSILESLDPLVASQYASLKPQIQTPEDFYKKIDVKAYFKAPRSGKMISRTTLTSLLQQSLTPEQLARSCNFDPEILSRVDMGLLTATQQQYQLQVLESLPPSKGGAFIRLNLSGCAVQEDRLIRILEKMPNLEELDLCGCNGINVMTITKLLAHRPNATFLTYNYEVLCPKLRVIRATIEDKNCTLALNMSFEQRQQLTQKMLDIISRIENINKVLLKKLKDSDSDKRRLAVDVVAEWGKAEKYVIEAMVKMLDDTDENVRLSVAVALVRLRKVEDLGIRELLKFLESADLGKRKTAAEALGRLGRADGNVIEALLGVLGKSSDKWVSHSVDKLRSAAFKRRYNYTKKNLRTEFEYWEHAGEIIDAMAYNEKGELGCTSDMEAKIAPVRASAAEALGHLGRTDNRVISSLRGELWNSHWCVRVSAARALIRLRNTEEYSLQVLLQALKESKVESLVRQSAVEALGNLGIAEDSIVEPLLRVLQDSEWSMRRAAATALGNLGKAEGRIVRALLSRLRDVSLPVRKSVAKALRHLGRVIAADEVGMELAGEREDFLKILNKATGSARERQYAAEALGVLEKVDDDVIEALLRGLKDSSASVRAGSAETLGYLAIVENRVIEGLLKTIRDWTLDISAVEALSVILNSKNLWAGIQKKIQQLAAKDLMPVAYVDEERTEHVAPELPLSQVVKNQNWAVRFRFFGRSTIMQINMKDVELSQLNHVALASQRAINVCALNGMKRRCRVIPAEPDGDCGFTGTRRALDVLGRLDIASQISRAQFIVLVRDEFKKEHSPCKSIILHIFKADRIVSDDENSTLEEWCAVFVRKSYWMQEIHFQFLSMIFNIEFCFYCVDNDKNVLIPERGNESLYAGHERANRIVVDLLHMVAALRDENAQLNHFDGLVISPTLEQAQRIEGMFGRVVDAAPSVTEGEEVAPSAQSKERESQCKVN